MEEKAQAIKKTRFSKTIKSESVFAEHGLTESEKISILMSHQAYDCLLAAWDDFWERDKNRVAPIFAEVVFSFDEEKLRVGVSLTCQVKRGKNDNGEIDGLAHYDWAENRVRPNCSCCTDGLCCGERLFAPGGSGLFKDYYNLPFPVVVRTESNA